MRARQIALVLALILVTIGVGFIYWPAALVVAGLGLAAWALFSDDGKDAT